MREFIINIAGYDVKLIISPGKLTVGDTEVVGYFERTNRTMRIDSTNLSEEKLKAACMHEVIHAIFDVSGLTQHLSDETEELICANLESFLTPLVNFDFSKFIELKPVKKRRRRQK